jgi:hypothetical protein
MSDRDIVTRLRTACSPESPLGKLCSEAAKVLEAALAAAPAGAVKPSDIVRWIEWAGGDFLPVPPEMKVMVLLRDGSTEGPAKALEFAGDNSCWKHRGASGDIVAYTSDLLFASPVSQATDVPEGWKLVPIRPTEEMIQAAVDTTTISHNFCEADLEDIYLTMVAIAPAPKAEGEQCT